MAHLDPKTEDHAYDVLASLRQAADNAENLALWAEAQEKLLQSLKQGLVAWAGMEPGAALDTARAILKPIRQAGQHARQAEVEFQVAIDKIQGLYIEPVETARRRPAKGDALSV